MCPKTPERQEKLLNLKRKELLMISVGGGLQLPLMEGDKIRIGQRNGKTVYYWLPLCGDGKMPDLSRSNKGDRSERYLHPRFVASLRRGNHLVAVSATDFVARAEETPLMPPAIKKPEAAPRQMTGKRKPLLRIPVWGLPPRWR
jgi:hypothetical protein